MTLVSALMKNLSWHIILAGSLILSQCTRDVSDLIRDQKPSTNSVGGSVTVTQSGGNTRATEGGAGDDYTIVLTVQPAANVTITVNPGSQLSATPASLVFSAACPGATCWSTPRTVTLAAVDDALAESNHTGIITHTATSTDTGYNGIAIASVTANITDNDSPGVSITESGGSTTATEGGTGDSYTVVLTFAPTATVTITVTPNAQVTATPTPLTFTSGACPGPGNWCTAQTVTVGTVNDVIVEGAHNGTITHTAASGDTGYNGIAIGDVTVNITDNDVAETVTNVTSPLADGSYSTGTSIDIQVTFSNIVNVTGSPRITLATGSPPSKIANYVSGSGTNTLTFNFTTTAGMNTGDLEYTDTAALTLNGGTIKNASGVDATLTLPGLGGTGSLSFNKAIVLF